jgi:hypothetical protein
LYHGVIYFILQWWFVAIIIILLVFGLGGFKTWAVYKLEGRKLQRNDA